MKPLLYAGALLMAGASIYGFVDYKKTSRDKGFKNLYKQTKVEEIPVPVAEKKETPETLTIPEKQEAVVLNEKTTSNKKMKPRKAKRISAKLYSRAALETYEPPVTEEVQATKEIKVQN